MVKRKVVAALAMVLHVAASHSEIYVYTTTTASNVTHYMNLNRKNKGLERLEYSKALEAAAKAYLDIMADAGLVQHNLMRKYAIEDLILSVAVANGEVQYLSGLSPYELLASIPGYSSPTALARIFDSIEPHAWVLYNENARYIGVASKMKDGITYLTVYVAVDMSGKE